MLTRNVLNIPQANTCLFVSMFVMGLVPFSLRPVICFYSALYYIFFLVFVIVR